MEIEVHTCGVMGAPATEIVLHDGRRFQLVTRRPARRDQDLELVLRGDHGAAGEVSLHLDRPERAEVRLMLAPGPSAAEAGAILLSEAAEVAAGWGVDELVAAHHHGDSEAAAVLDGTGLGYRQAGGADEDLAVFDLRPLRQWPRHAIA